MSRTGMRLRLEPIISSAQGIVMSPSRWQNSPTSAGVSTLNKANTAANTAATTQGDRSIRGRKAALILPVPAMNSTPTVKMSRLKGIVSTAP